MALTFRHPFVSAKVDGSDASLVQPSNWNADHVVAGGAKGDVLVFDGTQPTGLNGITAVAAGHYLRSAGVTTLPAWSTLVLPDSATQGDLLVATGANTMGSLADVATGSALISGGVSAVPTWGKVGLTTHVSGTLPAANGGTGIASYAVGDLVYASASTTLTALAAVAAGKYLRSAGVTTAPVWSTLVLPNSATQGDLMVATSANTVGSVADVAIGQVLASGGVGAVPAWTASPTLTGLTLSAGTGTQTGSPSVVIFSSVTPGSNVGTAETDLISYTMPANTLSANGQGVRVTVWGTTAGNGNLKTYKVYFGGSGAGRGASAFNNVRWLVQYTILRTGASAQTAGDGYTVNGNDGIVASGFTNPGADTTAAIIIKVTGTSATGSNDVTATGMKVEWLPA